MENTELSQSEPVIESQVQTEPIISESASTPVVETSTVIETPPTIDYSSILKEKTNGKISSFDDIENVLKDYESLKTAPKHEYANDFSKKLDEFIRTNGESADIESFIRFQKIDTEKLNDFDLIKTYYKDIKKMNLSEEDLNEWIVNTYKIDPNDEIGFSKIEKIDGKIKFEMESKMMKSEIDKWKASLEPKNKEEFSQQQQEQNKINEQQYLENQRIVEKEAREYLESFSIKANDIESKITLSQAEKENIVKGIGDLSSQSFWNLFQSNDKGFDMQKFTKTFLYAANPELIEKTITDNAFRKGVESVINGAKNPNLNERTTTLSGSTMTAEEIRRWNFENNK